MIKIHIYIILIITEMFSHNKHIQIMQMQAEYFKSSSQYDTECVHA